MSEATPQFETISDLVNIDARGRGHVSNSSGHDKRNGQFISNQNLAVIESNQDLIRDNVYTYQFTKALENEAPEEIATVAELETVATPQHLRADGPQHLKAGSKPTKDKNYIARHLKVEEPLAEVVDIHKPTFGNRHPKARAVLGRAAAALLIAGVSVGLLSSNESEAPKAQGIELAVENSPNLSDPEAAAASTSSSTSTTEATTSTTVSPEEQAQRQEDAAAIRTLAEMGIGLNQVTRITDFNQNLLADSPIEASSRSMNLGLTHNSNTLTVNSSLQLSIDVLKGVHGADRAELAKQSLLNDGYSQAEVDAITNGDLDSRAIYVYRLNTSSATIKHTDYRNSLGNLAYDPSRPVGANDAIVIAVEKANTDNVSKSRVDCGHLIQTIEDVDVPPAPVTPPPEEETPPTTVPPTTTTVPPTTTTTVPPTTTTTEGTTTTTEGTTTSSTTTSSTVPSSTTTEVTVPKTDPTVPDGEVTTTVVAGPPTPPQPTTSTVPQETTLPTAPADTTTSTIFGEIPVDVPPINQDSVLPVGSIAAAGYALYKGMKKRLQVERQNHNKGNQ